MKRLPVYRTYAFKPTAKDPIIDKLRTLIEDKGASYAHIHENSGVSTSTLYNWFNGKTRRPQFSTIAAVAGALGKNFVMVDKNLRAAAQAAAVLPRRRESAEGHRLHA